jgi:hypothetical protein
MDLMRARAFRDAMAWLDSPSPLEELEVEGHLPRRLQEPLFDALGPTFVALTANERSAVSKHRPDLWALYLTRGGDLFAPVDAVLVDPAHSVEWRIESLRKIGAPGAAIQPWEETLERLRAQGPSPLEWERAVHLPTHLDQCHGLVRRAHLARLCVDSVRPHWRARFPSDGRLARLAELVGPDLAWTREGEGLRNELGLLLELSDCPSVVRAVVGAYDRITDNPDRVDQTEHEFWCAATWAEGPDDLCEGAKTTVDRSMSWYRWWLCEALPAVL